MLGKKHIKVTKYLHKADHLFCVRPLIIQDLRKFTLKTPDVGAFWHSPLTGCSART